MLNILDDGSDCDGLIRPARRYLHGDCWTALNYAEIPGEESAARSKAPFYQGDRSASRARTGSELTAARVERHGCLFDHRHSRSL
jgi:hypothetical protein